MHMVNSGVVVFHRTGRVDSIDGIDEYSRRLVDALGEIGMEARYETGGLSPVIASRRKPRWVLLQYNPFRYGRAGFAPGLLRDMLRLRRAGVPLVVMVHESWVDMTDWRTTLAGSWQRLQLRVLARLADAVMASTESFARQVGHGAVHIPVATNVTPVPANRSEARARLGLDGALTVALFGRAHPSRALDHAEAAIAALAEAHGPGGLSVLNLGADAPLVRVPLGVEVRSPGRQTESELSVALTASDLVLLPLVDGVSTRRGTLMAALAHGRPVVGLVGGHTDRVLAEARDAISLAPAGDRAAFARATVEVALDPERRMSMGEAGRCLYASHFDWPLAAGRVASVLERVAPKHPRIVFVANDVGGSGGMERQSEELVRRLLDSGHPVTVVARTCALPGHRSLKFRRVPTPARPFTLAYPAFFVVASLLAAHRRNALLHATGAIVASRADVSTVHYCHRSAATRVDGSRASRAGRLYRLNATMAKALSLAGERWCYRPARTRLLCAVSGGVARELEKEFPAMRGTVRTVPNGVDGTAFRPDPDARLQTRARLGVARDAQIVMFVGGDWARKGLRFAVDALALAPDWHLVVAGPGDPGALSSRARDAGTLSRLHFLGSVRETARLYAAADAFVLPTAYEAFPLVVLEAAASGLPLLVTRVNGAEELIQEGRTGWFIGRDGADIARRLNQLSADPVLARAMAERSRSAAAGYSWEAMAAGYVSVYSELTRSGR